ncbi:MAG: DUF5655 domain-containing protein [Pseudomonadota bacterium]
MAKSPAQAEADMIAGFKEKTGKTLDQWLAIAKKSGADKHGVLVAFLKSDHNLTHGFANMIALKHFKSDAGSLADKGIDLVAAQYAGDKAALRPIYDTLEKLIRALGDDIEISPKKAYASVRRSKQFAIIQPSTKTRVDLGLNLKGVGPAGRLEASGSFNSMVTHRVKLETPSDVDKQLSAWLKRAYDQA